MKKSSKNVSSAKTKTPEKAKFRKLPNLGRRHIAVLVVFVVAFAAVGTYMLNKSKAATRTAPSIDACLIYKRGLVLRKGTNQTGCTAAVQLFLRRNKYPTLPVDGQFGDMTLLAVASFQAHADVRPTLKADGVVGEQTWNYIESLCKKYANPTTGQASADCTTQARY